MNIRTIQGCGLSCFVIPGFAYHFVVELFQNILNRIRGIDKGFLEKPWLLFGKALAMGLMCTPEPERYFLKKGEIFETLGGKENLLCALKLYEKSRRLCKALSGALGTIAEDGG